jgi:hypothetical protein
LVIRFQKKKSDVVAGSAAGALGGILKIFD